ncbi:hypothetical protein D3C85_1687140 [compost metagenome]
MQPFLFIIALLCNFQAAIGTLLARQDLRNLTFVQSFNWFSFTLLANIKGEGNSTFIEDKRLAAWDFPSRCTSHNFRSHAS